MAQVTIEARSTACAEGVCDLFFFPALDPPGDAGYEVSAAVFAMKPASRGTVRLASPDPRAPLAIDHGFLADERDARCSSRVCRRCAGWRGARPFAPMRRARRVRVRRRRERHVRDAARGFFHPVGTCAIGAVVDGDGRVHGIDGLSVADASIMPSIPRANTNLSTIALAERLAERMLGVGYLAQQPAAGRGPSRAGDTADACACAARGGRWAAAASSAGSTVGAAYAADCSGRARALASCHSGARVSAGSGAATPPRNWRKMSSKSWLAIDVGTAPMLRAQELRFAWEQFVAGLGHDEAQRGRPRRRPRADRRLLAALARRRHRPHRPPAGARRRRRGRDADAVGGAPARPAPRR